MSSEPADTDSPALAHAKRIGRDVEDLVVEAVDELEHATDPDAHYDAVTVTAVTPTAADDLLFGSVAVVEAETEVEVKGARVRTEVAGSPRGRWFFKGRDDGQHAALLDAGAMYVLAVYREDDDGERHLCAMVLVPASVVDELLRGRWYDSHRREGKVAKMSWTNVLDPEVVEGDSDA